MTAEQLDDWLTARRAEIDRALDRFLPSPPDCPPQLADSMRYSIFAGGKRLRPALTLAAAEAADAPHPEHAREIALPAACALEMIHTYSLVHDDLPAMDDDVLRRGKPTNHVVFGEGVAIIAGDALLTEAFALLAREPRPMDYPDHRDLENRKLRTIGIIATAAGASGMAGGQAIDLAAAGAGGRIDADGLRGMHTRKTGALIRAAASAGAVMAGGSEKQVAAIDAFGAELGLAFQIVDDILDVEGAADQMGKTAGKDAAAAKPTYPALYGVAHSRALAERSIDRALTMLRDAGVGGRLPLMAQWVLTRTV